MGIELVDEVEQVEQGEDQGDVQVEHAKHDQDTGGNSDMVELPTPILYEVKIQETTDLVLLLSLSERAQGCYGFDSYFHVSHFSKSTISYVQPGTETTNTWYCCNISRVSPQHVCLKIYSHISNFHKSRVLQLICFVWYFNVSRFLPLSRARPQVVCFTTSPSS